MRTFDKKTATIFFGLIGIAVVLFYFALTVPSGNPPDQSIAGNPAINNLIPSRGDEVLAQSEVAIELAPEYAGRIVQIADVEIPYDDVGNLPPGSPNPLNRWSFRPGENMVLDRLPSDTEFTCVIAEYWPVNDPQLTSREQWCFSVT